MPSTASFSLMECRHFFHWATEEWTYTLEADVGTFPPWHVLNVCKTKHLSTNSLSVLGPQPHSRQNAAHFLGFFSHQIWILCAEVWAHPVLQQVTLPVNSRSSATLNQDRINKFRKNSFLVANCQCGSSVENKPRGVPTHVTSLMGSCSEIGKKTPMWALGLIHSGSALRAVGHCSGIPPGCCVVIIGWRQSAG